MMKRVEIVVVNFRTRGLVIDCLHSLAGEMRSEANYHVAVVENGSGDDSGKKLQDAIETNNWGSWVTLLPAEKNLGFAGGSNVALRPLVASGTMPDYVLLLNPDTVVRPGAIRGLVEFMEANPQVGIAGTRLEDPDGTPQRSAFRFPCVSSEFENGVRLGFISHLLANRLVAPPVQDQPHVTDWVAGASMIVRPAVLTQVGVMDEDYFLYFEETDFCLQAKRAGWPCWYVPASRVIHLVGQASGVTDVKKPAKRVPRYWFESRRRYFVKNHGWFYAKAADTAWLTGFALWRIRRRLQGKPDQDPPHLLWDFFRFSFLPR
jgi:GT2 family glycosyltransferase